MPKKEGYYIETNCLQWLNTNITYESASIRVAWQTIRCEYFVALQNGEEYTLNRAIKHKDLNRKKVLYLAERNYIDLITEDGEIIYIEDVLYNSDKIKDISAKMRRNSNVRWHKKDEKKDNNISINDDPF